MHLRLTVLIVSLALGMIIPAHARLGETEDQLTARYGKGSMPWRANADYPVEVQMFYKDGTTITVKLIDGISVGESYEQSGGVKEDEMKTLLTSNAQGHEWKEKPEKEAPAPGEPVSKVWFREDGAFAFYKVPYVVIIKSKQLMEADDAKKAADAKAPHAGLQGF